MDQILELGKPNLKMNTGEVFSPSPDVFGCVVAMLVAELEK